MSPVPTLPFSARRRRPCACRPVSREQLRKAFYGVMHRALGDDEDFQVLRAVPEAVMEFCDTEDTDEVYSIAGRVIGLVRILSTPRGRQLSRVSGSAEMERAIDMVVDLPISDDLRFNEKVFWDRYAKIAEPSGV